MPPNVSQVIPEIVVAPAKAPTEASDIFEKLLTDEMVGTESETEAAEGNRDSTRAVQDADADESEREGDTLAPAGLALAAAVLAEAALSPAPSPSGEVAEDAPQTGELSPVAQGASPPLVGADPHEGEDLPPSGLSPLTNLPASTQDETVSGAPPPAASGSQAPATGAAGEVPEAVKPPDPGTFADDPAAPAQETVLPGSFMDVDVDRRAASDTSAAASSEGEVESHLLRPETAPAQAARADGGRRQPAADSDFQQSKAPFLVSELAEEPTQEHRAAGDRPRAAPGPGTERAPAAVSAVDDSVELIPTVSSVPALNEVNEVGGPNTPLPGTDVSVTVTANLPEPIRPLVSALRYLAHSGESSIRLQLQPEHIGRVNVQVAQQTGGLQIQLVAEAATTARLIQAHMTELQNALASAGVHVGQLSVAVGQGQAWAGHGQQPPFVGRETSDAAASSDGPHATSSGSSIRKSDALVDLRV